MVIGPVPEREAMLTFSYIMKLGTPREVHGLSRERIALKNWISSCEK